MANYPYAKVPAKLEKFFQKIQVVGVPDKATSTWLKAIGFTSSNDASMIGVLRFIGFVDSSKVPTDAWQAYRDRDKASQVLAESVHLGYAELFDQFNDAYSRSKDELGNFFRAKSTLGDKATSLMVKTFTALCSLSHFGGMSANGVQMPQNGNSKLVPLGESLTPETGEPEPTLPALHLDVQIHISADASPEQIDHIFESMAKHLYSKGAEQIA